MNEPRYVNIEDDHGSTIRVDMNELEQKYGNEVVDDYKIEAENLPKEELDKLYNDMRNFTEVDMNTYFREIKEKNIINPNGNRYELDSYYDYLIDRYLDDLENSKS